MSAIEEFEPAKYEEKIEKINQKMYHLKEKIYQIERERDSLRNESMKIMKERNREIDKGLACLFE